MHKNKKSKVSLYDYIVFNCPKIEVNKILVKYGKSPAKSANQAIEGLKEVIRDGGEDALVELGRIHPDQSLILPFVKENHVNAGGCPACFSGIDGEEHSCFAHSNAEGEESKESKEAEKTTTQMPPLGVWFQQNMGGLLVGAVGFGVIALLIKQINKS